MSSTGEGVVTLIIGAAAILGASLVPPPPEGETWAGVLPMGAAICLTLTGALITWSSFRSRMVETGSSSITFMPDKSFPKILMLVILAVLYHQSVLRFGYELPTAITAPVVLWLFGVRNKFGLALSAILYPLIFHILFFKLLGVFPPFGTVFDLIDFLRG